MQKVNKQKIVKLNKESLCRSVVDTFFFLNILQKVWFNEISSNYYHLFAAGTNIIWCYICILGPGWPIDASKKELTYYKLPKSLHLSLYMDEITCIMNHKNSALYELKHLRIPLTWALLVNWLHSDKTQKYEKHLTWDEIQG